MPELPDVEGFRRLFADHAAGQQVERAHVPAPDVLRNTTPQGLGRALRHRRFAPPRRHGKWLLTSTQDGATVVWHFGMTGSLRWAADEPPHPHDRLVLHLDSGELRLRMMRKLGGVWLLPQGQDRRARPRAWGPVWRPLRRRPRRAGAAPAGLAHRRARRRRARVPPVPDGAGPWCGRRTLDLVVPCRAAARLTPLPPQVPTLSFIIGWAAGLEPAGEQAQR